MPDTLTIDEAAEYLRCSIPSAYSLAQRKAFKWAKICGKYVIKKEWLDEYMERMAQDAS
jgi:excisionase family DNA binding protein